MVSVPEQARAAAGMLERRGVGQWATFSELVADCEAPIEIVGRFLALLELYRARAVAFDQVRTAWCAAGFVDRRPADQRTPGTRRWKSETHD